MFSSWGLVSINDVFPQVVFIRLQPRAQNRMPLGIFDSPDLQYSVYTTVSHVILSREIRQSVRSLLGSRLFIIVSDVEPVERRLLPYWSIAWRSAANDSKRKGATLSAAPIGYAAIAAGAMRVTGAMNGIT